MPIKLCNKLTYWYQKHYRVRRYGAIYCFNNSQYIRAFTSLEMICKGNAYITQPLITKLLVQFFRESLDYVLVVSDEHDWNSRNFPETSLQVLIACRHDKSPPLLDSVDDAVIGVSSLVVASQSLESWVLGQLQSQPVPVTKLF